MNKLTFILILIGCILIASGVVVHWWKSRNTITFYMNYEGVRPGLVTLKSSRPIDDFPVVLKFDGIPEEKVWFTDKHGKVLESDEEPVNEGRLWFVKFKKPQFQGVWHLQQ